MITPLSKENISEQLLRFSTADLENLVVKFPYFHQAHLLLAKRYQQESNPKFDEQLQMAALYTQVRELLYALFNDNDITTAAGPIIAPLSVENEITAPIETTAETISPANPIEEVIITPAEIVPSVPIEEEIAETPADTTEAEITINIEAVNDFEPKTETQQESEAQTTFETKPIVEPTIEATTAKISIEEEEIINQEGEVGGIKDSEIERPSQHFSLQTPHTFDEWLSAFADSASLIKSIQSHQTAPRNTPEEEDEQQDELEELIIQNVNINLLHEKVEEETHYSKGLDRFIEEQVQKRKKQSLKLPAPSATEPVLVTETLAKLYESQHKYVKAISTYELLTLKYPEKKGLFADRIENLKKLL